MTGRFADGFESGDLSLWTQIGSSAATVDATARSGSYALKLNSGNEEYQSKESWVWDQTTDSFWVGIAFKPTSTGGDVDNATYIISIGGEASTSTQQYAGMKYVAGGGYGLYIGATSDGLNTQVGTDETGVFTLDTWHWIELRYYPHGSTGVLRAWVNGTKGTSAGTDSGDTQQDASTSATATARVFLKGDTGSEFHLDDIVAWDSASSGSDPLAGTSPIGEMVIEGLSPSADTADEDFTVSTGTDNYATIDEVPFSDSDYNASNVVTDKDIFDYENRTETGDVMMIVVATRALKSDANARTLEPVVVGSSSQAQTEHTLTESAQTFIDVLPLDIDGTVWDTTAINALQAGYQVAS